MHEIITISQEKCHDVMELVEPLTRLLRSESYQVQISVLPTLGNCLNQINRFFKLEILQDLWDLEKFSIKESQQDFDIERQTQKLWELTKAISNLGAVINENPRSNWREAKEFYQQLIIAMDGFYQGSIEANQALFEHGWREDQPE